MIVSQVEHYSSSKRQCTVVYSSVNDRNRQYYDRKRAVEHKFSRDRITAVTRRAVYMPNRQSDILAYISYNDRFSKCTFDKANIYYREFMYTRVCDRIETELRGYRPGSHRLKFHSPNIRLIPAKTFHLLQNHLRLH